MNARFQTKESNGGAIRGANPEPAYQQTARMKSNSDKLKISVEAIRSGYSARSAAGATAKRLYDVFFSFIGLVLLSPLLAMIALLIKIADGGDVFYRQARVGLGGREFFIFKFRTMVSAAEKAGPSVTKNGDSRITRTGRFLRKGKLDELPQLWNVLKGDMSLVGPRPEVARYVQYYTPEQRAILQQKPGITDLASLRFRDEESLLANASNVEEFYINYCIPRKLELNQEYAARATLMSDTWIILQTVCPYWVGVLVCYGLILAAAFCLSCELVYNFEEPGFAALFYGRELCLALVLQLAFLTWHRQCRGLLSYFSFPEVRKTGSAVALAAVGLLAWSLFGNSRLPANLIIIDALLSFCLLSSFRMMLRQLREGPPGAARLRTDSPTRVGIIGGGRTGALLAEELMTNRKSKRKVVAFFDDDFHKWQKNIHDVPVAGMPECLLDGWKEKLDEVVIAMPSAAASRVREIERLLRKAKLKFYIVSSPARFWERNHAT
jgi:lipopolysaccharide/colanic/teichoic acid biosynthesis glycosyltransferase